MSKLIQNIKELRGKTEMSISEIRKALIETNDDIDSAFKLLSQKAILLKKHTDVIKNQKNSAFWADLEAPVTKNDFYNIEQAIENIEYSTEKRIDNIEYKLENIEDLLNEILDILKNGSI